MAGILVCQRLDGSSLLNPSIPQVNETDDVSWVVVGTCGVQHPSSIFNLEFDYFTWDK